MNTIIYNSKAILQIHKQAKLNYNVYDAYLGSKTIKKTKEMVIIELRTIVIFGQKL